MEKKKNPKLDYRKKSVLFFNIGLVLSLLFVISAFEWNFSENMVTVYRPTNFGEDELSPPITEIKPPKPKIQVFQIKAVHDDVKKEELKFEPVIVFEPVESVEEPVELFDKPVEKAEEAVIFAEVMPAYEGGISEFYRFVRKNLKYPAQARRLGIEGKVFVNFVVDKDGSLTNIEVTKGIGAGCDEEVLRIINLCPKWNPGKQRGRPVKVQMMLPITFRLK